jgi:hypothetical protein
LTKIETYGFIKNRKVKIPDESKSVFYADVGDLKEGCPVKLIVETLDKRSTKQNNYYWATVVPMIRRELVARGNRIDNNRTHLFLKLHFNPEYVKGDGGEILGEEPGSTRKLSKAEFSNYVDSIVQWAAEKLGITIPPAGEQTSIF